MENNIISEVHSSVACFSQIGPSTDNRLHYHPFSLYHCFSPLTHFLFPLIHSTSLALRFLSVGCDTIGRCGQDSSVMPVKDKLVSVQWDARHTSACTASSVWGLEFVGFLLFFHSRCLSVSLHARAAGCCQRFCRRMNGICGFFVGSLSTGCF